MAKEKMETANLTCGMYGMCHKCMGLKALILGVLILLNVYLVGLDWAVFVGAVIALAGIVKMLMPNCSHCR